MADVTEDLRLPSLAQVKALIENEKLKNIYVTPQMYGAVGDGVTNDTVALQSALDSGKNVYLTPGKTYLTNVLYVPSNTTIVGYGAILKAMSNAILVNKSDNINGGYEQSKNITVLGVEFTAPDVPVCGNIAFIHTTNATIRDCIFHDVNAWHMIEFNACFSCIVDNCYFYNYGLNPSDTAPSEMIQLDYAYGEGAYPFSGAYDYTGCKNIIIRNSVFIGDNIDAVRAIGNHSHGGHPAEEVTIENCYIENFMQGILLTSFKNSIIRNNTIKCSECITSLWYASGIDIIENRLEGYPYTYGAYTSGRNIYGEHNGTTRIVEHFRIIGNICVNAQGHAIGIQGNGHIIKDNRIYNAKNHGIYLGYNQHDLIAQDNIARDCGGRDVYVNIVTTDTTNIPEVGKIVLKDNVVGTVECVNAVTSDNKEQCYMLNNVIDRVINLDASTLITHSGNYIAGVLET